MIRKMIQILMIKHNNKKKINNIKQKNKRMKNKDKLKIFKKIAYKVKKKINFHIIPMMMKIQMIEIQLNKINFKI